MALPIHAHRPFNWGVLIVGDSTDLDLPSVGHDRTIGVGRRSIVIPVRHAQDIPSTDDRPFAVSISCDWVEARPSGPAFETVIDVRSGELLIGDADSSEKIRLERGSYRLFVVIHPDRHAEQVTVGIGNA
ncbi:MAG: hypothetical protein GY925_16675 [Actinomycetia bacterium]|nr:hypothetical protein [Actinomycetes bacterium]